MRQITTLVFILLPVLLLAQPLARYNLYTFNQNFSNPAATGLTNCTVFNATDMHQWIGISDAPSVQSFSVQKGKQFLKTKKYGLGANIFRDANGPSKSLGGELIYSFHAMFGRSKTNWLSLGLSGNFEQRKLDQGEFSAIPDPIVSGEVEQELAYNASSGVFVYNEKYFAGFAVYNLLPLNSSLGLEYGGDNYFLSFQGGYIFSSRRMPFKVQSSFQAFRGTDLMQLDITNKVYYENNFMAGLTLRKNLGSFDKAGQNAIVFIGYEWSSWNFSYSYNIDINGTQFHHYGTHQLSVGYKICPSKYSCPTYSN
jgi:type IX secretion system PorP/SprF family membrane protein